MHSIYISIKIEPNLVLQKHKEADGEGRDEEEEDDGELAERGEHVGEHDDVDAEHGELADEEQQVHPAEEHGRCADIPLPQLWGRSAKLHIYSASNSNKGNAARVCVCHLTGAATTDKINKIQTTGAND